MTTTRHGGALRPGSTGLSRRGFLQGATAVCGAVLLPPFPRAALRSCVAAGPRRALGLQLYTVRDQLKQDFEGTLAELARIGYLEVEFAGLHGRPASQVRAILDRLGLTAPAGHAGLPEVTEGLEQTLADAVSLGFRYLVVPWLPADLRTADGYARVAELFNRAGERLQAAGLMLGYHNHDFEFAPLDGGPECGYDILLRRTDPALVTMELDLFWIRKGGRDALRYLALHRGRFRLVHIKEMAADGAMVDLGQGGGAMDWPTLLTAARLAGVEHWLAEHDTPADALAFAREGYGYLAGLEW